MIGLHYFSPVDKMPLVEVIPHAGTSEETIATTVALAHKQGKTAIVVGDSAGFTSTASWRRTSTKRRAACWKASRLSRWTRRWWTSVSRSARSPCWMKWASTSAPRSSRYWSRRWGRAAAPAAFDAVLKDGRKGRKNGRGFYLYPSEGQQRQRRKRADTSLYTLLGVTPKAHMLPATVAQRCVMMMLNEAARCPDEGVIRSARDGDVGAVFGIGFPPFLGGPFRYMDELGAEKVVKTLDYLRQQHGEHFAPCERLQRMAQQGERFTRWGAERRAARFAL